TRSVPGYAARGARLSMADRFGRDAWSRRRHRGWCRAGRVVLLSGAPRPGGSVLLEACPAASESATPLPLAFTIQHPAHRLTAGGVLAVTLVGTPGLVVLATAFAQAEPRPRSSRPGTAAALWSTMRVAHGSVLSQGTARGERTIVLRGRLSKPASSRSMASLC